MTDLTLESLAARVERLEQQDRKRAKIIDAERIATNSLIIFGPGEDNGRPRASIFADEQKVMLTLHDAQGLPRLTMEVDDEGAGLSLRDGGLRIRVNLGLTQEGAELNMNDETGNPRVILATDEETGPGLTLFGTERQPLLIAP